MKRVPIRGLLYCSFCRKSQDQVSKLISSPGILFPSYICDECIAVCNSILEKDSGTTATGQGLRRVSAERAPLQREQSARAKQRSVAEPSKKENWLDRVKSWWKYGMIGEATLPDNV